MMNTLLLRYGLGKFDFTGAIVSNLADGICAVDNRGRITYMNEAAERLLFWTESELLGKNIHRTLHRCKKDDASPTPATRCTMLEATRSRVPLRCDDDRLKRKDGEIIAVTYSSSPLVVNEQIVGTIFSFRDMTERERELETLRQSEERYRSVVEASPDCVWLSDLYGFIIMANRRAAEMMGYAKPEDMLHMGMLEMIATEDRPRAVQDKRKALGKGSCKNAQYTLLRQNGASFPAEVTTSLILGPDDKPQALMSVARDITHLLHVENQMKITERSMSMDQAVKAALTNSTTLLDMVPQLLELMCTHGNWDVGAFWNIDSTHQMLRCRTVWHERRLDVQGFEALCRQLSIAPGIDLPGRVWNTCAPIWVSDITADAAMLRGLMATKEGLQSALCVPVLASGKVHGIFEFFSRANRPTDLQLVETMSAASDQIGKFLERKDAEHALEYQAMHDALTDLPNRALFQERLQGALSVARGTNTPLAICLLDLNRFHQVNDSFGQAGADLVLQEVAHRLQQLLRDSDTVARLNGDEFAIILPGTSEPGAEVVVEKFLESLARPFTVSGQRVDITGAVGVAVFPQDGTDAEALLRHADVGMHAGKRGRSGPDALSVTTSDAQE